MHQVDCGVNFAMVFGPVKRIRGSKGFTLHPVWFGRGVGARKKDESAC